MASGDKKLRIPLDAKNKLAYSLPVFFSSAFYDTIGDKSGVIIHYGGAGSGKSVNKARLAIADLMCGQRNYLIVRKVYGTLKDSFYSELIKAIHDLHLSSFFKYTKSPLEITHIATGKKILFRGLDDPEKIKSITPENGSLTDIIVEEATEISEDDYNMLDTRLRGRSTVPKRMHLLFNPIYKEHWIYERFFLGRFGDNDTKVSYDIPLEYSYNTGKEWHHVNDTKTISIFKSTHVDNEFLEGEDHARYEAFKDINAYYYNVYCLGNWGILGDIIFDKWEMKNLEGTLHHFKEIYYGLDFGWYPDPYAMVVAAKRGSFIYVLKEIGGTKRTNQEISREIASTVGSNPIFCDSAENKSIEELKIQGIDARAVAKWKDNNSHAIQYIQNYTLVIDYRCKELLKEIKSYVWDKDKEGRSLRRPADGNDHYIQALYYSLNNQINNYRKGRVGR